MGKKPTEQNPQLLRAAAEAPPASTAVSPRSAEELLHEIHAHQIELEMQNEQLRQAQLALEESRDRYVDLYEFAPIGYVTLTQQGIISEINLTGANLIGVERKKLLQRNFKYFIAPGYSESWNNYLVNVLQKKRVGSCELALKRGDGHIFPVQLDCLHIKADIEAPVHIVFTDITARKHAEEELRIAAIAFETHDGMMVTDIKGVIVRVNYAFTRLTGYSAEEVVGKTPALFKSGRHDQAFYRRLWSTLAMKRYWQGELWNRRKDGTICADWLTISAVNAPDGRVTHYVSTYSDITQNEALNRLQKISNHIPGVIYQYRLRPDGSSCLPFASDAIREIYRVSPEEVREDASKIYAILHPDDHDGVIASIQASARDLSPWHHEYRVKFDDGTVRWLFGNALPQMEEDGSVLWHGFITDITNRKQADEALRQSETKFRTLYDSTSDAVMLLDEKGFFDCNKATLAIFGCATKEELCSKHPAELSPPEQPCGTSSLALADQYIATAMEKGSCQFEWVHRRADTGKNFFADVLLNSMVLDGKTVLQATVRDITERKQVEEKLRESEASMRAILDNSPYLAWLKDPDGRYIKVNKSHAKYARQKDARQIIGKTDFDLWPKELAEKYRTDDGEVMASRLQKHVEEQSLDGDRMHWVETFKTPIIDENGKVLGTAGFAMDITERKLAEEALRESENRNRLLVENSPVCIHEIGMDGRITSMNPAGLRMMGTEDECTVRGFLYLDAVSAADRERIGELLAKAYAGETSHFEFKANGPQGLIFKSCFVPIRNKEGSVEKLMGITEDITERRQAEEKLQKFFDLIPELACIASTEGHFLKINPAWKTTLGYTEQEMLSTPFLDFIHPDDRDATMEEVARQLAGNATMRFTNRYRHKDGSYRWLEWTATSDVDKKLLYASARDITARKQAE